MSDLHAIVPVEDTRREMLEQQFDQAVNAPPGEMPREDVPRDTEGKFAPREPEQTMVQQAEQPAETSTTPEAMETNGDSPAPASETAAPPNDPAALQTPIPAPRPKPASWSTMNQRQRSNWC